MSEDDIKNLSISEPLLLLPEPATKKIRTESDEAQKSSNLLTKIDS